MVDVKVSDSIGMKRVLTNLPQPKQLDVIAEGLPILMKNAGVNPTLRDSIGHYLTGFFRAQTCDQSVTIPYFTRRRICAKSLKN